MTNRFEEIIDIGYAEIVVDYSYWPAEKQEDFYPGCDEEYELHDALFIDPNIGDLALDLSDYHTKDFILSELMDIVKNKAA